MRVSIRRGVLFFACCSIIACGGKDDDDDSGGGAGAVQPGALLTEIDMAMSSIAFEGQGASLALNSWTDQHCENEGNGTKSAYDNDEDVVWGCKLAVKTDGPDTPRGGFNRLVQLGCEVDRNLATGALKVDGKAHEIEGIVDDTCWGAEFAKMVAKETPDLVGDDGFVHVKLTITGHNTVPEDWNKSSDLWNAAFEIHVGFDDPFTYKMLLRDHEDGMAASILKTGEKDVQNEVFAVSLTRTDGPDDEHEFRYEGRFPFDKWGDGSGYGSRHLRVLVVGPYTGSGGFASITGGDGYEVGMHGDNGTNVVTSGLVSIFGASNKGIGTKTINVDKDGAPSGTAAEHGVKGLAKIEYSGSDKQIKAFLTSDVASYTEATTWFKSNAPLDYKTVVIGD